MKLFCTLSRGDKKSESLGFHRYDANVWLWTDNGGARKHCICSGLWNAFSSARAWWCFTLLMASESQGTLFQNGKPNISPKNLKPYQAWNWLAAWPFTSHEEENEDDDDDNEAYLPAITEEKAYESQAMEVNNGLQCWKMIARERNKSRRKTSSYFGTSWRKRRGWTWVIVLLPQKHRTASKFPQRREIGARMRNSVKEFPCRKISLPPRSHNKTKKKKTK